MAAALIVLAAVFVLAGVSKLAGVSVARENFERWGMGDRQRLAVGVVEIALASVSVVGTGSNGTAVIAAVGALALMAGALRTHIRVHDKPKQYAPLIIVVTAAIIVLVTV